MNYGGALHITLAKIVHKALRDDAPRGHLIAGFEELDRIREPENESDGHVNDFVGSDRDQGLVGTCLHPTRSNAEFRRIVLFKRGAAVVFPPMLAETSLGTSNDIVPI